MWILLCMLPLLGFADPALTQDIPPLPLCVPFPECLSEEKEEVLVRLVDPVYSDGVLSTDCGGVLLAPDLIVRATAIAYTHLPDGSAHSVHAEGELVVEYRGKLFVGSSLDYDFLTDSGVLCQGRVAMPPWYIAGERIYLTSESGVIIEEGTLSSCEGEEQDWDIFAPRICIFQNHLRMDRKAQIRIQKVPVLALPALKLELRGLNEMPISTRFSWGGFQGTRLSLRYRFFDTEEWKAYARLDAILKRGLGGGVETSYLSQESAAELYTQNYYAHDISIADPTRRDRYRFDGSYYNCFDEGRIVIRGVYDRVSDPQMAADYQAKDFDLKTAGKTELSIMRTEELWRTELFSTVRLNSFQTVNQELPTLAWSAKPYLIGEKGVLSSTRARASYLDYLYSSSSLPFYTNFHSGRFELDQLFYKALNYKYLRIIPELGGVAIGYTNSPSGAAVGALLGYGGAHVQTTLVRSEEARRETIEPYIDYVYYTAPTSSVDEHYIFTIADGYARLHELTFGTRYALFSPCNRALLIDLHANAFFNTEAFSSPIPRAYLEVEWDPLTYITLQGVGIWDFQEGELDTLNGCLNWTVSRDVAISTEYRHRSSFAWRKADHTSFFLEAFRQNEALRHSPLSDRRDTLLLSFFYRWHPDWFLKAQLRHGWNRHDSPNYTEYQIDLSTLLCSHWRATVTYEKRFDDFHVSFSLRLDNG